MLKVRLKRVVWEGESVYSRTEAPCVLAPFAHPFTPLSPHVRPTPSSVCPSDSAQRGRPSGRVLVDALFGSADASPISSSGKARWKTLVRTWYRCSLPFVPCFYDNKLLFEQSQRRYAASPTCWPSTHHACLRNDNLSWRAWHLVRRSRFFLFRKSVCLLHCVDCASRAAWEVSP